MSDSPQNRPSRISLKSAEAASLSSSSSRLVLIIEVRASVGDEAIIIVNANDRKTPQTAPYVNGYCMECYRSKTAEDWQRIADTLSWAEQHLR